jgi:hypothetical protein
MTVGQPEHYLMKMTEAKLFYADRGTEIEQHGKIPFSQPCGTYIWLYVNVNA